MTPTSGSWQLLVIQMSYTEYLELLYFRIGTEWGKTALQEGWRLLSNIQFQPHHDPQPAMAAP